jgi:hypothetical protein
MKIMDLNEIKLGKAYLYGDSSGRPEAIVWPAGRNLDNGSFWGRILTTENYGAFNAFFSLGSFYGPDKYHCFLRELTDDEVNLIKQRIILKLDKCFRLKDKFYLDAGFEGEARKFAADLFAGIFPPLVPGREVWAAGTNRPKK